MRAGQMALRGQEHLLCLCDDLSSNAKWQTKAETPVTPVLWEAKARGWLGLASHQPHSLWVQRPCLWNKTDSNTAEHIPSSSDLHWDAHIVLASFITT